MINKSTILEVVKNLSPKRILLLGDIMLDKYTYGNVQRISPEAPISIIHKQNESRVLGGAANMANNIVALGSEVILVGLVGNDLEKDTIFSLLQEKGIDTSKIIVSQRRPTTVKHRFVAAGQQLLRVDRELTHNLNPEEEANIISLIEKNIDEVDVIIVSDYAKGCNSSSLMNFLINLSKEKNKKILVDPKPKNKEFFKGVDLITPNLKEGQEISGEVEIDKIGEKLMNYFNSNVLITRGNQGMTLFLNDGNTINIEAHKVAVADIVGAGDTIMAAIAVFLANGLNLEDAARLANLAGSIVVQKSGTSTVTHEELKRYLNLQPQSNKVDSAKIVNKVWGHEKWLENNEKYCSKILVLKKNFQCSLHHHKVKDEMFLIRKGLVKLELGDKILSMSEGDFVRVLPGINHRFTGIEDSEILEISTHHEDEDSYRLEKSRKVEGVN